MDLSTLCGLYPQAPMLYHVEPRPTQFPYTHLLTVIKGC